VRELTQTTATKRMIYVFQRKQEAQLPLREQGVSLAHSSHHNATLGHLAF